MSTKFGCKMESNKEQNIATKNVHTLTLASTGPGLFSKSNVTISIYTVYTSICTCNPIYT